MSEKRKVGVGIFPKILLVMVVVSLIPLALIWYSSNLSHAQRLNRTVDQRLLDTATALGTFVDSWIEMNVRMLKQNATLPSILSMNPVEHKNILQSIVQEYDWNYLAHTLDQDGINIGRSDDNKPKNYSDRTYLKQVLAGRDLAQQVVIGKTSGKPALVLAAPIHTAGKHATGVLSIAMTLTEISQRITNSKIEETGYAFLMDEFGKVIAHPNQKFTNQREDFSNHPAYLKMTPGKSSKVTFTENGHKVISIITPIKQGWSLVVQQNYDEAFAELEKSNQQALIFFAATFVLALIMAFFVSRRLASPIRRLTDVAEELSRGSFNSEVKDVSRNDELGELARAVERLGISVRLATERFMKQRTG